jgi:hypothetical protein
MLVCIEFVTFGAVSSLGNFAPKDRARVSPGLAKHLVEEVRCARYVQAQSPVAPSAPVAPPPVPEQKPAEVAPMVAPRRRKT